MNSIPYVIGIDFGTDSVRSIIIDATDGSEIASDVVEYPRWKDGKYCDPSRNQFRQHPLDYIEGMEASVRGALLKAPSGSAEKVVGLGIDTTGSTPVAVNQKGQPLALTSGFEENPNAMFVLWKDHTAVEEAAQINDLAKTWGGEDFTKYEGGVYSSEWYWSKILHIVRADAKVHKAAFSWVEHCDWIVALLTGNTDPFTLKRSRCAAGHKAMWHESWNGLPSEDFLVRLDPQLSGLRKRLYRDTFTSDVSAGTLSPEWASRLALRHQVHVAVGAFDAHLGAVGAEIIPYHLCKVMGTSTCDMLIAPMNEMADKLVQGICGQVDGSIIPGMLGMEAGQSAFGDIYAWFKDIIMWPLRNMADNLPEKQILKISGEIIPQLSEAAEILPVQTEGILALDWMNGRRTPDANQRLKGAISGLNLGSDAVKIFKALVEATAFGAKKIVDRFISEGVPIQGIIGLGGVAKKADYVMQVVTNVLNMPMRIARSEQTVALGSAMAAATAAGIYPNIEAAQKAMGNGFEKEYLPDPEKAAIYQTLYEKYSELGAFIEMTIS